MGREGKVGNKAHSRRRNRSKDKRSDESDEDYTVGGDEEFNDSEEYCSSFAGDESEESLGEFEEEEDDKEEEEEEKPKKIGRSKGRKSFPARKKNRAGKARKKRRAYYKVADYEDFDDEDYDVDVDVDVDVDDDDDDEEEEEEEEDEEEFVPDETDIEDEDELAVRKKNKKVGRPSLREKGLVKGQKRKRNAMIKKRPMRKNPAKSCGLRRKSASGNDGAFVEKNPIVKRRSKKKSGRRKRTFMADSESDFVSSGSSDFEYSISEEEREQVREASKFCRNLTASLRNSSSTKRLQGGILCQQRKRRGRKGKEMAEDLKNEAGKQVCGICLSEEGKMTVQGTLNCCSHYFCFPCIMEWSKVESRCPLCKQRFVTISKLAKSNAGFELRTVVVQVPERDQVYQPSEEELRGYLDPYENMICTECQQGGDDALMLLCDICDSPAHTYCVGLGCEVPEGNWYCEGCRPTALCNSNRQASNPTPHQRTINNLSDRSSADENVREAIDLNLMYVPETPTQGTGVFSSPRGQVGDSQAASSVSGAGVSTVSVRRRVHRQIHHLRNNRSHQIGGRDNGMPATALGNNHLGSHMEWDREIAVQHAITAERLGHQQTFAPGRLQDNFSPSVQSRDLFPPRSNHSRDRLIRGQTSASADSSVNRMLQAGISWGINSRLGYDQLRPCSSRSSVADDHTSPYGYREVSHLSVEKEQVQSMVRSHLKSLSREMELGYSTLKDIARKSTHTILAACGLEHRGSEVYPIQPPSICDHVEGMAVGEMSLMKGWCSSCFDSFVRHVVKVVTNARAPPLFRARN